MSSERHPPAPTHRRRVSYTGTVALCLVAVCLATDSRGVAPRYYPDDPISADNDRRFDAGGAVSIEGSNGYDFIDHTFFKSGDHTDAPAANVNTIGEVPDSTWFTNRIGRAPIAVDDIARGPNELESLDIDGWPIVQGKSSGVTPGYRVIDPAGHLYQIKFDPPANPEMGSGAEVIGAAIYHALGYNVVQGYVVEIDPARIVIAPTTTTVDLSGRRRRMRREDVDRVLERAARLPNGRYRAIASRFADGRPLGYFKYYGTRPDDPNDVHPHERRRELRANRVFAAWLNHDDSRALNTLDMLEGPKGRQYIRHYMFDFGSTLGSGSTVAQVPRAGNEYILEWVPALKTLATLGLYVRPWILVNYPPVPSSVGRFEADFFDPAEWRPEYPNPAFDTLRPDDAFWAARLVARFSDEAIKSIVAKARYSDPRATEYVAATLIKRRDKVVRTWLTAVNPVVEPALHADGTLTFGDAAVGAALGPSATYRLRWSKFDNATGNVASTTDAVRTTVPRADAPLSILDGSGFVRVEIRTEHKDYPHWAEPVQADFRRTKDTWELVGLRRGEE